MTQMLQYLLEGFYTTAKTEYSKEGVFDIYQNPNLYELSQASENYKRGMRGIINDNDLYVFDSYKGVHGDGMRALRASGIETYNCIPMWCYADERGIIEVGAAVAVQYTRFEIYLHRNEEDSYSYADVKLIKIMQHCSRCI